ncbi:hypothetical protein C1924_16150 [Stenotrophomonas sp. ESTM1D_MKCIP4_1]|uniref:hypothetical protein n=1 Tax=Stenotrophomonas sp. ESTM1D_MKCIP4_1 TaxID=2072414 RepID=UPI000D53FDF3|nr:hypothetical protein [Stenotrophomonas sp. ESTM1D_MKCIP4_1]AWH54602.1 hypothetical protein C1924_16150 [Stenotrophomonas sp. ESTM1D_MKCIP4_1]
MRRSRLLLPALGLALLTACQGQPPEPGKDAAGTDAPATNKAADGSLRWSESVVWDGDLNACRQGENNATRDCLAEAMKSGGASADAVAAAEQLSTGGELAYVTAWHEHDGLGVATVEYPFRANTNEGTRLVDAGGKRIDVDAVQLDDTLRADPSVQAVLAAHPQATPFAPAQASGTAPLDGGGIRLLYRTPLRDCHACPDVGQLQIGYDFDGKRNFIGQQVVPAAP